MDDLETIDEQADAALWAESYEIDDRDSDRDRIFLGRKLIDALEAAAAAEYQIEKEQEGLRELLADEVDPIRVAGREYQIDLVERQLTRASSLAKERIDYLTKIKTPAQVEEEFYKCKTSIEHWFKYYAWGFDPRPDSSLNTIPLGLFPFQANFVHWLDYLVFKTRQSGAVPKSRDMGATECALRWAVYHWLFDDTFEVLLLSRTEDEVDSKEDVNTLFEKIRFQLRLLPEWMLPRGFSLDKDMPYMKIKNPENGSTFHGRAPTTNVGRQLRVACVLYDEFAFAPNGGYLQHTSLSSTSKSIITISSVAGRQNKFADLITDGGRTPVFQESGMDWREHPWKDQRWYDALPFGVFGVAMTAQQIAQEIDRDLDASQPGKVWKFKEEFLFMSWEEFLLPFEKFGHGHKFVKNGKDVIPEDWRWSRYHDYGQTKGHEWAYLNAARPSEFYPMSDTIFVFTALNLMPTGLTEEQAVRLWTDYETDLGLRGPDEKFVNEPFDQKNSHEQKSLRETLLLVYGEEWQPWSTDYIEGISQFQAWCTLVDKEKPNPYREDLFGRYKIVFVGPRNCYRHVYVERNAAWIVTNSKNEKSFLTCRKQLAAYHYPEEERGKDVKKMRPAKVFDDLCFIAGTQILTSNGERPIEDLKIGERVWTRQGWKRIIDHAMTNAAANIFTLTTNSGKQLTGTGNHPIITKNGEVCLRDLGVTDIIFEWQKVKQSFTKTLRSIVTLNQNNHRIETIFSPISIIHKEGLNYCIKKYGKIILEKYRKVFTSITKMAMSTTTTSPILSAYLLPNTLLVTQRNGDNAENLKNTLRCYQASAIKQKNGTARKKAENGTASTVKRFGLIKSRKLIIAPIAQTNSPLKHTIKSFAQVFVNHAIDTITQVKKKLVNAWSAKRFLTFWKHQPKGFVQESAVKEISENKKKAAVYNLTVEDAHEYIANGILVHNCDCIRALAVTWGMASKKMTKQEQIEKRTSPELREAAVAALYGQEGFGQMMVARMQEQNHIKAALEEQEKEEERAFSQRMKNGRVRVFGNTRRR